LSKLKSLFVVLLQAIALLSVFVACGDDDGAGPTKPPVTVNKPPAVPSNPVPADGATGVSPQGSLHWACSDPESDPLTFYVHLGTSSPPPLADSVLVYNYSLDVLRGETYYWKIEAVDTLANRTSGPVWSFTTEDPYLQTHGTVAMSDSPFDLFVAGNYAYVADNTGGLQIVRVFLPDSPSIAANYPSMGIVQDVYVEGNMAYIANSFPGLEIADITSPESPAFVDTCVCGANAWGVHVSGSHAFFVDLDGLEIADVSTPSNATIVGSYDLPGWPYKVHVSGDYAYVACRTAGLQIVDVSNPSLPTIAGSYDTPDEAWDIEVVGTIAYVSDYHTGLLVIDVSNPASPTQIGDYVPAGAVQVWGISVSGDYAYVTNTQYCLTVLDITDPTDPVEVVTVGTPCAPVNVFVLNNRIYLTDWSPSLRILHFWP
jgi:hypothetical protein